MTGADACSSEAAVARVRRRAACRADGNVATVAASEPANDADKPHKLHRDLSALRGFDEPTRPVPWGALGSRASALRRLLLCGEPQPVLRLFWLLTTRHPQPSLRCPHWAQHQPCWVSGGKSTISRIRAACRADNSALIGRRRAGNASRCDREAGSSASTGRRSVGDRLEAMLDNAFVRVCWVAHLQMGLLSI